MRRSASAPRPIAAAAAAAIAVAVAPATAWAADSGFALAASGEASVSALIRYPEEGGGIGDPRIAARLESELRLSAEGPSALFRVKLDALADSAEASSLYPESPAPSLGLELREAEASLLPSSALALRGGLLLRDLGVGSYGSPVNPFAREEGQAGFWGIGAEWTPVRWLSSLAILSADRLARSGEVSGIEDYDAGTIVRFSPGGLDAAIGLYASGAAGGELRPIAFISVSPLSFLISVEAAASFPGKSDADPSASARAEIRKSLGIGDGSLEIAAAYRGVFPGRGEDGIAALFLGPDPEDPRYLPFAPFYGRHYAELSLYLEGSSAYSLSIAAVMALPSASLSGEARAEAYIGDARVFIRARGAAGGQGGEFPLIARLSGNPGLEIASGVEVSF
jgi:hypothetical protein